MACDDALAERMRAHLTKDADVVCLVCASGVESDPAWGRISTRRVVEHQHPVVAVAGLTGRGEAPDLAGADHADELRAPIARIEPPRAERPAGDRAGAYRERTARVGVDEQVVAALRGEQPLVLLAASRDDGLGVIHPVEVRTRQHQRLQVAHLTRAGVVERLGPEVPRRVVALAGGSRVELHDRIVAVGVAACAREHRPVGVAPRVGRRPVRLGAVVQPLRDVLV